MSYCISLRGAYCMKISIYTLGCKANYCDSESMAAIFAAKGHEVELGLCDADVCIINTCSVTKYSDHKSRQAVAKALRISPNAGVYVVGCSAENDSTQFGRYAIAGISGTYGKEELAKKIAAELGGGQNPRRLKSRKRGFVKIQDGCDNYCTYCIVPYLRGISRSRSIDDIVTEAADKSKAASEIVLSGINIAAYGQDLDEKTDLTDLVEALGVVDIPKRLGSLSPTVIDNNLLAAIKTNGIVTQFHMPLQSGSDKILGLMGRRYTAGQYIQKVQLIRKMIPNASITTDVIVGFPGETEEDFGDTVSVVREVGFDKVHTFPFSARAGTKAYDMPSKIDERVIKDRLSRLDTYIKP